MSPTGKYKQEKLKIPVAMVLDDGTRIKGFIMARPGRDLEEILNGSERFFDFQDIRDRQIFIATNTVGKLTPLSSLAAEEDGEDDLTMHLKNMDPYKVLGVTKGALPAEVQAAYHRGLKLYHPDRFSRMDLPDEIASYLLEMTKRLNEAYKRLAH